MPPGNWPNDPPPRGQRSHPDLDRIRWEPLYPAEQPGGVGQRANRSIMPRVVALLMLGIALAVVAGFFREISAFFGMIEKLSGQPTEREAFLGFAAFGFALVAVLAVLKIVLSSQNHRGH